MPLLQRLAGALLSLPLAGSPALDLDVAVPPGSPLDWSRAFPAITPAGGPLFPETPESSEGAGGERTAASGPAGAAGLEAGTASSFALVRILTWDLAAHVRWIESLPPAPGPATGRAGLEPPAPRPGDALYWMTVAPIFRLHLHPQAVSRAETMAHLVELGMPALTVLQAAAGERELAETRAALEALIRPARDAAPSPPPAKDAVGGMHARFVMEELLCAHPHDPVGRFGARLFLFGDELLPLVSACAVSDSASLRRNATAALSRYAAPEAARRLFELAAATDDPVVLVRAAAGISTAPSGAAGGALIERMGRTQDPPLFAALCGAARRAGLEAAVPRLLELGKAALPDDPDLLMTVLAALADLRPRAARAQTLRLAQDVQDAVAKDAADFAVRAATLGPGPDNADPAEMRGEILAQLALILRVRLEPTDEALRRELLAWREALPLPARPAGGHAAFFPTHTNDSLRRVHPPVRFLYLATLGELGEEGAQALAETARDRRTEPALRGYALGRLSAGTRVEASRAILADLTESAEMRVQALEVAAAAHHPDLPALCRAVLAETAALEPGGGKAEERYLGLAALRALGRRGALALADLKPLLAHVKSDRSAFGTLPEELLESARELVALAAAGAQRIELERSIEAMLAVAVRHGINAEIGADTRGRDERALLELVASARAHASDPGFLEGAARSVLDYLLGYASARPERARGEFEPAVALEEEILLALGRTGEAGALELLLSVLGNRQNRHRAAACLALGILGRPGAERTLVSFLLDGDPFVRLCAYRSLKQLTGKDVAIDWMYGTLDQRSAGAEEYLAWLLERR